MTTTPETGCSPASVPLPSPSKRLRHIAIQVERLALTGRFDGEEIVLAKERVAQELRKITAELELGR
jgi:hypothetical protein